MDSYNKLPDSFNIHYDVRMDSETSLTKTELLQTPILIDDYEENRESIIIPSQPLILRYKKELQVKNYYLLFVKSITMVFILTVCILVYIFYK